MRRRFVDDDEEGFHENAPFSSERCEGGAPLKLKMAMRNENIRVLYINLEMKNHEGILNFTEKKICPRYYKLVWYRNGFPIPLPI